MAELAEPIDDNYGEKHWNGIQDVSKGKQPIKDELALAGAYRRVFMGSPSRDDQEMVLADMAAFTGFYRVSADDVTQTQLMFREGRRQAYSRTFSFLSLSAEDVRALENAAREESVIYGLNN